MLFDIFQFGGRSFFYSAILIASIIVEDFFFISNQLNIWHELCFWFKQLDSNQSQMRFWKSIPGKKRKQNKKKLKYKRPLGWICHQNQCFLHTDENLEMHWTFSVTENETRTNCVYIVHLSLFYSFNGFYPRCNAVVYAVPCRGQQNKTNTLHSTANPLKSKMYVNLFS